MKSIKLVYQIKLSNNIKIHIKENKIKEAITENIKISINWMKIYEIVEVIIRTNLFNINTK